MCDIVMRCLGEVVVTFEAPTGAAPAAGRTVGLYLLELSPAAARARQDGVLQFSARLLVTTWAPDAAAAADDLAELAFACLAVADLDVDFEPLPAAAWSAFGVAPRASFMLRAPVRRTRTQGAGGPPVRVRTLHLGALRRTLAGVLLAQDDRPVAGARIDLPALDQTTMTGADGRFRFASVPSAGTISLQVQARGMVALYEVPASEAGAPIPPLKIDLSQPQP